MTIKATVCHIIDKSGVTHRLLLQKKSVGLFGEGKWNGVGGKLKVGETPSEGAAREVFEEAGLIVSNLKFHGVLDFYFGQRAEADWKVCIFSTSSFKGELRPSEEGILKWFTLLEIPYTEMWQDDIHWLPLLLEDKRFEGKFYFNKDGEKLVDFDLKID